MSDNKGGESKKEESKKDESKKEDKMDEEKKDEGKKEDKMDEDAEFNQMLEKATPEELRSLLKSRFSNEITLAVELSTAKEQLDKANAALEASKQESVAKTRQTYVSRGARVGILEKHIPQDFAEAEEMISRVEAIYQSEMKRKSDEDVAQEAKQSKQESTNKLNSFMDDWKSKKTGGSSTQNSKVNNGQSSQTNQSKNDSSSKQQSNQGSFKKEDKSHVDAIELSMKKMLSTKSPHQVFIDSSKSVGIKYDEEKNEETK
jgi:hypothetical protein